MGLQEGDLQILMAMLHPAVLVPQAHRAGLLEIMRSASMSALYTTIEAPSCPAVLGAYAAYRQARRNAREYIRYARKRDAVRVADLDVAFALRHLGLLPDVQGILFDEEGNLPWRRSARAIWHAKPGEIPGRIEIPVGSHEQSNVNLAAIKAVSAFFIAHPHLNKALLRGALWRRLSEEVLVTTRYADRNAVSNIRFIAHDLSLQQIQSKIKTATWKAARSAPKAPELLQAAATLLREWVYAGGFIASPASAMVSCMGGQGVQSGHSALCTDLNGIPVSVVVGKVELGKVAVSANIDHRVWDGSEAGTLYQYLAMKIPKILEEEV